MHARAAPAPLAARGPGGPAAPALGRGAWRGALRAALLPHRRDGRAPDGAGPAATAARLPLREAAGLWYVARRDIPLSEP